MIQPGHLVVLIEDGYYGIVLERHGHKDMDDDILVVLLSDGLTVECRADGVQPQPMRPTLDGKVSPASFIELVSAWSSLNKMKFPT